MKLVVFFVLSISISNAQEVSETDVQKIIEKDFSNISKSQLKRLVPYYDNNDHAGFIDYKTREVIVSAKYYELDFFKPNLKGNYNGIYLFEYNPESKKIEMHLDSETQLQLDNNNIQKNDITSEMNGFSLTDDKKVKNYSKSYSSFSENIFFYQNKYYGIAYKNKKYGIVDEDGNPLNGFDFNYDRLELNTYSKEPNIWFRYINNDGESGYTNLKGDKKFVNEFNAKYQPKTWTDIYCANASETFYYNGFSIENSDTGTVGVLDLINMKWIVKSTTTKKIVELNYSSDKKIEDNKFDTKDIKLYILMYDNERESRYYIDENLVEYKPAK